jgi:hypothetical protein
MVVDYLHRPTLVLVSLLAAWYQDSNMAPVDLQAPFGPPLQVRDSGLQDDQIQKKMCLSFPLFGFLLSFLYDIQQLQTKHNIQQSQMKHDIQQSQTKHDIQPSQTKHDIQQSQTKHDIQQSQTKHDIQESQTNQDIQRSQTNQDIQQSQTNQDIQQPQHDQSFGCFVSYEDFPGIDEYITSLCEANELNYSEFLISLKAQKPVIQNPDSRYLRETICTVPTSATSFATLKNECMKVFSEKTIPDYSASRIRPLANFELRQEDFNTSDRALKQDKFLVKTEDSDFLPTPTACSYSTNLLGSTNFCSQDNELRKLLPQPFQMADGGSGI